MTLIKILSICLIAAILAIILKQYKSEYSLIISISVGVIVLLYLINSLTSPIEYLEEKLGEYGIKAEYLKIAIKALAISYLTGFISDTLKDCGQTSLANKAELAGKCSIFIISIPLITSILDIALGFLK